MYGKFMQNILQTQPRQAPCHKKSHPSTGWLSIIFGVNEGTRTHDPRNHNPML